MKLAFRREILILFLLKIIIFFGIHSIYRKYQYTLEKCIEKNAIIVKDNFTNLPSNIITNETIYFLETSNTSHHELTARQACAIESAAFMNPDKHVLVLFLTPESEKYIRIIHWPNFKNILRYKNIHINYFYIDDIVKDTPLEEWIKKTDFSDSRHKILHLSDMLRYALLYKYSGIYLDLDVISLHPIDDIHAENFACLEEIRWRFQSVNNAILKLSNNHGHELARMLINGVIENYDRRKQWEIGPRLLTKTLKKYCKIIDFKKSMECEHFKILPIEKCYAIQGNYWYTLFEQSHIDLVLEKTKDSYFTHLWNHQSNKKKISTRLKNGFNTLASLYCPLVFEGNNQI